MYILYSIGKGKWDLIGRHVGTPLVPNKGGLHCKVVTPTFNS